MRPQRSTPTPNPQVHHLAVHDGVYAESPAGRFYAALACCEACERQKAFYGDGYALLLATRERIAARDRAIASHREVAPTTFSAVQ